MKSFDISFQIICIAKFPEAGLFDKLPVFCSVIQKGGSTKIANFIDFEDKLFREGQHGYIQCSREFEKQICSFYE